MSTNVIYRDNNCIIMYNIATIYIVINCCTVLILLTISPAIKEALYAATNN